MLEIRQGDIFESGCDAIVNPVNCKGIMGAGLALAFKRRYPRMFEAYQESCKHGLKPGALHIWKADDGRYVVNFPTKTVWRLPSKIEYIESGLVTLESAIREHGWKSVGMPALGCGLGGLSWDLVRKKIEEFYDFCKNPELLVAVYEPK